MKILITLLLVILAVSAATDIDPNYTYADFMRQFGRTYDGDERTQHEQIFNSNYASLLLENLNGAGLVVNQFMDWNSTQWQGIMYFYFSFQQLSSINFEQRTSVKSSSSIIWAVFIANKLRLEKLRQSHRH